MAGYALSPAARVDIEEIWDYTVRQWGEAQAERYTRDIRDACEALGDGTLSGRSAEDIRAGYRKAAVGSHVMFYRVRADVVDIVRIVHRNMDVGRHIQPRFGGRSTVPGKVASTLTETPRGRKPARPLPLRSEPDRAGAVRLRFALGAKHVRECLRLAVFSQEPCLAVHHREVPGRQGGKVREAGGGREREPGPERLLHLLRREVVEPHLEDEPPQGGGVEVLTEVRGAREGEGMALHPGQHLVHLAHLPPSVRGPPVGEERIGFVEDEKGLGVARLGERVRDPLLGLADPGREQVGRALLQDLEPDPLRQVAHERALAGPGRTLKAEREAPARVPHETLGKGDRVGIGPDEPELEPWRRTLRRPFAPEHP